MTNNIVFFEISTTDVARARAFYSELFDWKFAEPAPGMVMIETGNVPGMLNPVPDHAGGGSTVVYFAVDKVRPIFERALAIGGTEAISPRAIPGRGSFAVFRDRDNNRVGIFSKETAP